MSKEKTSLDKAFEDFEKDCADGKIVRREMIESLRKVISQQEMLPSPYDKAMMVQAKVSVFKTLDDLLKSDEEVSLKKLKMKLARKDSETNGMVGQTVVALLKSIRASGEQDGGTSAGVDRGSVMAELQVKQEEHKEELKISEGELEACGSSPTTDGNAKDVAAASEKKSDDEDEEE